MKETLTCLKLKIGSCSGCSVQSLTAEKMAKVAEAERGKIVAKINKKLCPEGEIMQGPKIPSQNIW